MGITPRKSYCGFVRCKTQSCRFLQEIPRDIVVSDLVWIASYPRSGNTLVRTLLHTCLGLPSGSVYPNDLGGRKPLEAVAGHIEHSAPSTLRFPNGVPKLIKTHNRCKDAHRAIYVVRDGRAAVASLWKFLDGKHSLRDVVEGRTAFGLWQDHLDSWNPTNRADTLLLRYERITADPLAAIESLAGFLGRPIVSREIPSRETLSRLDGKWITSGSDWRETLTPELAARFLELNRRQMAALGYIPGDSRPADSAPTSDASTRLPALQKSV